jgi:Mrp family chromosome partitioning ATPase/capsular polysaccharide biosynthesis protein
VEPAELSEQAGGTYLRAIARHWRFVVFVTLVTTGVALLTLSRVQRSYEASASVLVTPVVASDPSFIGTGAVVDTGDPPRTVQTAAALIDSPEAAAAAAQAMGSGWTGQRVENSTSVAPRGQSNVLAITGRAPSAGQATRLADTFARAAVDTRAKIVQQNIAARVSAVQARVARLSRTVPATSPELQGLATQLGELRAAQDTGGDPSLSVSQPAQLGSATGASKVLILLIAALAGFALGSIAALAIEYFSSRIHDPNEVRNLVSAPILAAVPKVRIGQNGNLSPKALPPAAFEQVRMLRTQIPRRHEGSAIMITSADAGDGKTTLAAALAAAFAEADQDVILLDFDLRAPAVAGLLGLDNSSGDPGATNWKAELDELLVPVPGFPRLKALAAHTGDRSGFETLIERLPSLLAEARLLADWVIVDTPPIGEVSDAIPIAAECDEVLLVVRPGHTDRARLILARDLLSRIDVIPAGTVLIGQGGRTMSGRYYGYGYARTSGIPDDGNRPLRRTRSNAAGQLRRTRSGADGWFRRIRSGAGDSRD